MWKSLGMNFPGPTWCTEPPQLNGVAEQVFFCGLMLPGWLGSLGGLFPVSTLPLDAPQLVGFTKNVFPESHTVH